MKSLKLNLENCYGIRKLEHTFNFENRRTAVIYAPNGSMKSSFANTFRDIVSGNETKDLMFENRETVHEITDESGNKLAPDSVLVVGPIGEEFSSDKRTSTLLVNRELRKEYQSLTEGLRAVRERFVLAMKEQSRSKKDIEKEISSAFTPRDDKFQDAIFRISDEVESQSESHLAEVPYDVVFDSSIETILNDEVVKEALEDYVKRFNYLIDKSKYFNRDTFTYHNADTIATNLENNGFFKAKHQLRLIDQDDYEEITTKEKLTKIVKEEKDEIMSDEELRRRFEKIDKLLNSNKASRSFFRFISENESVLPHIVNMSDFKEMVWKSYFVKNRDMFDELFKEIQRVRERMKHIEELAQKEESKWREVVDLFNVRFDVPFELQVKNETSVKVGESSAPELAFIFREGMGDQKVTNDDVSKETLFRVLSTGERRAFYLLTVIFEIEVRRENQENTLIILDDVADSFDYKNKYAIIQYLDEISRDNNFRQIILTHNYDFFRSAARRIARRRDVCFMVEKSDDGISMMRAPSQDNIFVADWKKNFSSSERKRIASIPFIRNLIEYTKGTDEDDYRLLTSLLHIMPNTTQIMDSCLFDLYNRTFGVSVDVEAASRLSVYDLILQEARSCYKDRSESAKLENKIVLSIAIRLCAEKYMISRIDDQEAVDNIKTSQTSELLRIYRKKFPGDASEAILNRASLMTSENIHLNSFMYEPIVDMSDAHLRAVFGEVMGLLGEDV